MFSYWTPYYLKTKELSPDSVTATLSNTKVLEETVFCTLEKFINQKKLYN